MDEYYDHLDDVECPCPYHGALIQPLYPTAIKMLVYLAYYQEAGNCCQRTTKCRVHGCWEEKMDDFWTMRVPFCSRHYSEIVLRQTDLHASYDVQCRLAPEIKEVVYELNAGLIAVRTGSVNTADYDMSDEASTHNSDQESTDNGPDEEDSSDDGELVDDY